MYNGKENIDLTKRFIREVEEHLARTEQQIKSGEFWLDVQAESLRYHIAQLHEQLGETK